MPASITPGNVRLGPCVVLINDVAIGATLESEVTVGQPWRQIKVAQTGDMPIDATDFSQTMTAVIRIAEKTLARLKQIFPTGLQGATYQGIGSSPGGRATSNSVKLTLRPIEDTGDTKAVVIHKAVPQGDVKYAFGSDVSVYEITFEGYYDTTKQDGDHLGRIYHS